MQKPKKHLTTKVLIRLTACLSLVFLVSFLLVYGVMTHLVYSRTETMLQNTVHDIHECFTVSVDDAMEFAGERLAAAILEERDLLFAMNRNGHVDEAELFQTDLLREELDFFQDVLLKLVAVNIIDENGIIIFSNPPGEEGMDLRSSPETMDFLPLATGEKKFLVQPLRCPAANCVDVPPEAKTMKFKFAGHAFPDGKGMLEYCVDTDGYEELLQTASRDMSTNWHVGLEGSTLVVDKQGIVVSSLDDMYTGKKIQDLGIDPLGHQEDIQKKRMFTATFAGEETLCIASPEEGGRLCLAIIPKAAAMNTRTVNSLSIAAIILLMTIFQGILLNLLLSRQLFQKLAKVNGTLQLIRQGKLNERLDEMDTLEFQTLGDEINHTLDALNELKRKAEERIAQELAYARSIQNAALPSVFPPFPAHKEFDVYASMHAAQEVGGDFYDFFLVGQDRVAFLVADVSGKGIPAALFMMRTKTLLKNYVQSGMELSSAFNRTNQELCDGNVEMMFVTAWLGLLNLQTGEMETINAGHTRPTIFRSETNEWEIHREPSNLMLGAIKTLEFRKNTYRVRKGDILFLYTDGVTEAMNAQKELFGEKRMLDTLSNTLQAAGNAITAKAVCDDMLAAVNEYATGVPQADDITMLAWRVLEVPAETQTDDTRN